MDHFWNSITPVHDEAERHSTDQNVQFFVPSKSGSLNIATFKYSLHKLREITLHYKNQLIQSWHPITVNNSVKNSQTTFNYKHQLVNRNSTCLLCALNTLTARFGSLSGALFIASQAMHQKVLQMNKVLHLLTIEYSLQKTHSEQSTRPRSELLTGSVGAHEWWSVIFSAV